jgi:hypothetical protein
MKLLDNRGHRAKPASNERFKRLGFAQFFHRRKFVAPSAENTNGCKLSNEGSDRQPAASIKHSAFSQIETALRVCLRTQPENNKWNKQDKSPKGDICSIE